MTQYTDNEIRVAIDKVIRDNLVTGSDPVIVIFDNQDDTSASNAQAAWIKQSIVFRETNQFQLGDTDSSRNKGVLVFKIYVRTGKGAGQGDVLRARVVRLFRSRKVGGATFLNAQTLGTGKSGNWAVNALQIPFYFDSI